MTTYTVYAHHDAGHVYGRGLTAIEAAEIVLYHDGHDYYIGAPRPEMHTIETAEDLAAVREVAPVNIRDGLEVGCSVGRVDCAERHGQSLGWIVTWPDGRAALATNGDSVWGDVVGGTADLDHGTIIADNGEVLPLDDGWTLYVSRGSANSFAGLGGYVPARQRHFQHITSRAASEQDAWGEIAEHVIRAGWGRVPCVVTDDEYTRLTREA